MKVRAPKSKFRRTLHASGFCAACDVKRYTCSPHHVPHCVPNERLWKDKCDVLHDLVSVTIWRLHGSASVCECMLTLFSTFMSFLSICMSFHIIQMGLSNVKRQNAIQMSKH